jgi:hypothetical protein
VDARGVEGGDAPEECSGDNERLAREMVAEPAGERRNDHVNEEKDGREQADLGVVNGELLLDERLDAGKDVAVDEVEEIKGREKKERHACGALRD